LRQAEQSRHPNPLLWPAPFLFPFRSDVEMPPGRCLSPVVSSGEPGPPPRHAEERRAAARLDARTPVSRHGRAWPGHPRPAVAVTPRR
jgi:hypothetical protein